MFKAARDLTDEDSVDPHFVSGQDEEEERRLGHQSL